MTNADLKKMIAAAKECKPKDVKATVKVLEDSEYLCTVSVAGTEAAEYRGYATSITDARNRALQLAVTAIQEEEAGTNGKPVKNEKKGEPCRCGCGEICKPKRTFRQGHDARFHGRIRKLRDGRLKMADVKAVIEPYAVKYYAAEVEDA